MFPAENGGCSFIIFLNNSHLAYGKKHESFSSESVFTLFVLCVQTCEFNFVFVTLHHTCRSVGDVWFCRLAKAFVARHCDKNQ